MKNIFLITKREYLTQVKKKSFLILTLFTPVFIAIFAAFISFLIKSNETKYSFNVVDKSGLFSKELKSEKNINYVFV